MEEQGKAVPIDDSIVREFLREVMKMESQLSFDRSSQRSARKDKISQILEKYSARGEE